MGRLSNEDEQKKEMLLQEAQKLKEKRKECQERRKEIKIRLNPAYELDGRISDLERDIALNETKISSMEKGKTQEGEKSVEDYVKSQMLESKREMATSSAAKVQELSSQLATEKDRQRAEQEELHRLEQKYALPIEKPKGLLASAISFTKRFINKKNIAMDKQQTELDIKMTIGRVNEATQRVNVLEEKLRQEEKKAQFYQSDYEEEKAKEEQKRMEEERTGEEKKEKIKAEIQQRKETVEKQKQEIEKLKAERQKVLEGQLKMSKEEREQLKQKLREVDEEAKVATEELFKIQAQIKELDPSHYADDLILGILSNPFRGSNTFQQGTKTENQQAGSKKQQDRMSEPVEDKHAMFRNGLSVDNTKNRIEQNAQEAMEQSQKKEHEEENGKDIFEEQ